MPREYPLATPPAIVAPSSIPTYDAHQRRERALRAAGRKVPIGPNPERSNELAQIFGMRPSYELIDEAKRPASPEGGGDGVGTVVGSDKKRGRGGGAVDLSPDNHGKRPKLRVRVVHVAAAGVPGAAKVFERARTVFRGCYGNALAEEPMLAGRLKLRFNVGADGQVILGTERQTVLKNDVAAVTPCVLRTLKRLRFNAPKGGRITRVVFELAFG